MSDYFLLQLRMLARKSTDFGLHPVWGALLLFAGFAGGSLFLFSKTEFAPYLYVLIAASSLHPLSKMHRNEFLKMIFKGSTYFRIRLSENLLLSLPFVVFLLFNSAFLFAIVLLLIAIFMARVVTRTKSGFVFPTPFSRYPFEFLVGFRNSWYLIGLAYFLVIMSLVAHNFNLGAVAIIFTFLILLSFYTVPEDVYFVWSNNCSAKQFLFEKLRVAVIYSSFLTLPLITIMSVFFVENIFVLLLIQVLGYVALSTIILAKYSAYPDHINFPQGFLLAFSIQFPVLLLIVIPLFYVQSLKRLNQIL